MEVTLAAMALAVMAILAALERIRARHAPRHRRIRCAGCRYDLRAVAGTVCPECGLEVTSPPIHSWGQLTLAAFVTVLASQVLMVFVRWSEPWTTRLVPTTVWCTLERVNPSDPAKPITPTARVLEGRSRELAAWQIRWATPSGYPLRDLHDFVIVPSRWRAGVPLRVFEDYRSVRWSQWIWGRVTTASPLVPGKHTLSHIDPAGVHVDRWSPPGPNVVDVLRIPTPALAGSWRASVTIEAFAGSTRIGRAVKDFNVELVAPGVPILTPVRSEAADAEVFAAMEAYASGNDLPDVFANGRRITTAMRTSGLVEFVRDGVVVAAHRSGNWWKPPVDLEFFQPHGEPLGHRGLRVRFTGTEDDALQMLGPSAYWAGTVEIDLGELLERTRLSRAIGQ